MLFGWTLAPRNCGIIVVPKEGDVIVLEFNEFLARIASQALRTEDEVISRVFTNGRRRRIGDLRVYALIRSGNLPTSDLPRYNKDGILATGAEARDYLTAIEGKAPLPATNFATLLRAALPPLDAELARELLRTATKVTHESSVELPRPAMPPPPPDKSR